MSLDAPTYDLVLLLDTKAEPPVRAKIVADTRATIEAGGEIVRHDEWGERPLSYPIEKHSSAEYHLVQLHAPQSELLDELDRTLRITDGVLRFRIIKLAPGVASPPDMSAGASRRAEPTEGEAVPAVEAPAPAQEASEPEPVAETA